MSGFAARWQGEDGVTYESASMPTADDAVGQYRAVTGEFSVPVSSTGMVLIVDTSAQPGRDVLDAVRVPEVER
jgi:hypothetical protein